MFPVTDKLKNRRETEFQREVIPEKEDAEEEKKQAMKPDNTGEEQVVHNLQLLLSMPLTNPFPTILLELKPQNNGLFRVDLPWRVLPPLIVQRSALEKTMNEAQ